MFEYILQLKCIHVCVFDFFQDTVSICDRSTHWFSKNSDLAETTASGISDKNNMYAFVELTQRSKHVYKHINIQNISQNPRTQLVLFDRNSF